MATSHPFRAIDLFCGAGGLSQGFIDAGYTVSYALDKDADSIETYKRNHPGVTAECLSIEDLTVEEIATRAGGKVDVVIGGPSCQTFSTAGRKNGWVRKGDPRNDLWKKMLSIVEHLEPGAFLLENVPGMAYWKKGEFGVTVLGEFEKLGYKVSKEILLAADYGVPQRRRRLFLVGIHRTALVDRTFAFPIQTHMGGWRRDYLDLWETKRKEAGLLRHVRVWEAIGDLPATTLDGNVTAVPDPGRQTPFSRRMRVKRRTGTITGHQPFPITADHLELMNTSRRAAPGATSRATSYPTAIAACAARTALTCSAGSTRTCLPTRSRRSSTTRPPAASTHLYLDRMLTPREAARIQTFPDTYAFEGTPKSVSRQIGNAVPPLLAHVLGSAIATAMLGETEAAELYPAPKPVQPAEILPAPPPTDKKTRDRMKRQARRDTKPETLLRGELTKRGLRGYRKNTHHRSRSCAPSLISSSPSRRSPSTCMAASGTAVPTTSARPSPT